jgi:hypothetical protein
MKFLLPLFLLQLLASLLLSSAQPRLNAFVPCFTPGSDPNEGQLFWDSQGNPLLAAQQVIPPSAPAPFPLFPCKPS